VCIYLFHVQYYATVDAGPTSNIRWLTKEDIEDRSSSSFTSSEGATGFNLELSALEGMIASGQCVGGVVTETVGEASNDVWLCYFASFSYVKLPFVIFVFLRCVRLEMLSFVSKVSK